MAKRKMLTVNNQNVNEDKKYGVRFDRGLVKNYAFVTVTFKA